MSEQQQNSWPGWVLGTLLGLALGVAIGMQLGQEASPNQEVAQWVEAGFSEEESRILVSYGRAKLLPSEIRRLAQGGEPRPTAREGQAPARRSTQPSAPAQPPTSRKADAASAQKRLLQGCQALQAGKHKTVESWFTAMKAQGNPWVSLANRVQTEVPPEQQIAALKDAWRRLCTPRQPQ